MNNQLTVCENILLQCEESKSYTRKDRRECVLVRNLVGWNDWIANDFLKFV